MATKKNAAHRVKSSKRALAPAEKQVKTRPGWATENAMRFPQALRDAIPGPDLPGCDRSLILSSIDGTCWHSALMGRRVQLDLRVEESGKLTGVFDVTMYLNVDAARTLAENLRQLIARVEKMPPL